MNKCTKYACFMHGLCCVTSIRMRSVKSSVFLSSSQHVSWPSLMSLCCCALDVVFSRCVPSVRLKLCQLHFRERILKPAPAFCLALGISTNVCWCETDAFKGCFQLRGHYVIKTQTHVLYVKEGLSVLTFSFSAINSKWN